MNEHHPWLITLMLSGEQNTSNMQWMLQVVAQTPLHVLAVPVEQLLLSDPGGVVGALRQYIALQLTYWFSRCGMIRKQVLSSLR
jgi:hypothetical protein